MSYLLHAADEEVDVGTYQAYLRTQSDDDLMDIVCHLDPFQYPARLDAAHREFQRRHVLLAPVYSPAESAIRILALTTLALAAVTAILALSLTPAQAAGPALPADELHDGVPVSHILALIGLDVLRGVLITSVRLGLFPLLLLVTGYWTLTRFPRRRPGRGRVDVWRLAALACLVLVLVIGFSSRSAVPVLLNPRGEDYGGLTLLDPLSLLRGGSQ